MEGYLPLQNPPTADLMKAHKLLGYIKNVLSTSIDTQVGVKHAALINSVSVWFVTIFDWLI